MLGLLLLLTMTHGIFGVSPAQPQYTRIVWRVQDGLPEDTVQALAETKDGYLWVGTTGGLTRFDGTRLSMYEASSSMPALGVNSICDIDICDGIDASSEGWSAAKERTIA
ncbi:two-component regulator propeller domain-containing protein [Tunturiibacter empetritectus]|uniref:two-component regulator propeller domain-containing protein n=1 Tax=Tunturiibacter empetritectus TaxID=3069691 RepID=UPI003D9B71A7